MRLWRPLAHSSPIWCFLYKWMAQTRAIKVRQIGDDTAALKGKFYWRISIITWSCFRLGVHPSLGLEILWSTLYVHANVTSNWNFANVCKVILASNRKLLLLGKCVFQSLRLQLFPSRIVICARERDVCRVGAAARLVDGLMRRVKWNRDPVQYLALHNTWIAGW